MANSTGATARKVQYDNLVAILTVAAALALFGLAIDFTKRNASVDLTAYQTSKRIIGYMRPQAVLPEVPAEQSDIHAAFKNTIMPKSEDLKVTMSPEDAELLDLRYNQGVSLLHAKQYEFAITAFNQVIELHPKLPEAYVNIGYAYLGLEDWDTAKYAFTKAIDLKPDQANAYFGLAQALDGKKDYETALGAMRSFIHLSTPQDPFLAKARSALWEWEAALGRIPGAQKTEKGEKPASTEEGSPHQTAE